MNTDALTAYMESLPALGIPAAELLLSVGGKTVYHRTVGFHDAKKTAPATDNDLYALYSSSKVLTAVLGVRLIEEGKLSLDDAVSKYIREFANITLQNSGKPVPAHETLRIGHLFTMCGGVTAPTKETLETAHGDDTLSIVKAAAKQPFDFEPGTRFSYGYCLDVLGAVIEVITGMSLSEYARVAVARPLGMHDLYYHADTEEVKRRLAPHYYMEARGRSVPVESSLRDFVYSPHYDSGGAGVITTASDYLLLAEALANGGIGRNGARILSENSVREMQKNRLSGITLADFRSSVGWEGYGYGLGVCTLTERFHHGRMSRASLGQFGWGGLGGTSILMDTEKRFALYYNQCVVHMENGGFEYNEHPHNRLRELSYEALGF